MVARPLYNAEYDTKEAVAKAKDGVGRSHPIARTIHDAFGVLDVGERTCLAALYSFFRHTR